VRRHAARPRARALDRVALGVVASVLLAAGTVLAACGGGGGDAKAPEPPAPRGAAANDTQLAQGRTVYKRFCAECHGIGGQGGVGPDNRAGRTVRDFPNVADQRNVVEQGRNTMPGFQGILSPAQIDAVVRYEREVL
jgi:mono/diheme cytochrome c family protein